MISNDRNITTLDQVAKLIDYSPSHLHYYANNMTKHVHEHKEPKKSNPCETRTITAPDEGLKAIQRSIKAKILGQYPYPAFVYGLGVKTLKQHAELHEGNKKIVQVDLKDFYPSLTHKLVYRMWVDKFHLDGRAARILTKLTTMDGGLKQGFPTSSHISAITAEPLTTKLNEFCILQDLRFSQYVDDLNISATTLDLRLIFKALIPYAREIELTIKKRKTRVTTTKDGKVITGVSLYGQKTRATRPVRHRAIDAMKDLRDSPKDELALKRVNGYLGFLRHLRRSDGKKYQKMKKSNLNTLKK